MVRALFCSVAVLAFGTVGLTRADDAKPKNDKDMEHHMVTVDKVDAKNNSLTVSMKNKDGKKVEKTLQIGQGVQCFDCDGKTAKIDSLQPGDHLCITKKDGKITELRKGMEHPQATITKMDANKGTVTVSMKDKDGKQVEKTFKLEEDSEYIDSTGRVATLDVFRSGDQVLIVEREGKIMRLNKDTNGVTPGNRKTGTK